MRSGVLAVSFPPTAEAAGANWMTRWSRSYRFNLTTSDYNWLQLTTFDYIWLQLKRFNHIAADCTLQQLQIQISSVRELFCGLGDVSEMELKSPQLSHKHIGWYTDSHRCTKKHSHARKWKLIRCVNIVYSQISILRAYASKDIFTHVDWDRAVISDSP